MKSPVSVFFMGMLLTLVSEAGIVFCFFSAAALEVAVVFLRLFWSLLFIGGPTLCVGYADWKRLVNPAAGVALFIIGCVAYYLSVQWPPGLAGILLLSNITVIAWSGIFLAVFALYRRWISPLPRISLVSQPARDTSKDNQ